MDLDFNMNFVKHNDYIVIVDKNQVSEKVISNI